MGRDRQALLPRRAPLPEPCVQGWSSEVQRPPLLVLLAGQRCQCEERQVGLVQRQELLQETLHGSCVFDGCDRGDFFPKEINGWFWSANQARLSPTNSTTRFHDWSFTGGFNPPRPQPDNREKVQQGGEDEACMAVLNNFYGDGIKWHDVACHHEKPIVCEDNFGHLQFARQTFPQIRIP